MTNKTEAPEYATLPAGQVPMNHEEWAVNKSCEAKHRDHKWQWLEFATTEANAQCVHCGILTWLGRDYSEKGAPT